MPASGPRAELVVAPIIRSKTDQRLARWINEVFSMMALDDVRARLLCMAITKATSESGAPIDRIEIVGDAIRVACILMAAHCRRLMVISPRGDVAISSTPEDC